LKQEGKRTSILCPYNIVKLTKGEHGLEAKARNGAPQISAEVLKKRKKREDYLGEKKLQAAVNYLPALL